MKKLYILFSLIFVSGLTAQTTVPYSQQAGNYDAFLLDGGGNYDSGSDQLGMWANFDAKQSASWKTFTDDGTTTGVPTTMANGDSFTITVSATRAYGQIGMALLASPTATTGWLDRHNNYAVQVNLNGESSGSYMPWEVVSQGLTTDVSSISGSTSYADYKFKFTLVTATTMEVSVNDGVDVFNVTLDKTGITGYCIYLSDDWNGSSNADIFWKQTSEYTYAALSSNDFETRKFTISPNPVHNSFSINKDINKLQVFNLSGKLIKEFKGNFSKGTPFDISNFSQSLYITKIEGLNGSIETSKLVKL